MAERLESLRECLGKGKEVAASADADGDYGDAVNIRRIDFVFWTFQL